MILFGLALFSIGMVIDVVQHGRQFIMSDLRHAPLAHGLPLAAPADPCGNPWTLVICAVSIAGGKRASQ